MATRRDAPYVWVTWLPKLLTGDDSCEWAAWFKAHHVSNSWPKALSTFDSAAWKMEHTALLNEVRRQLEDEGYAVATERQNKVSLRGRTLDVTIEGVPDIIASKDGQVLVVDAKTGQQRDSDTAQVMIYMYAVPRTLHRYKGVEVDGRVVYSNGHVVDVPASCVSQDFIDRMGQLVTRLASDDPARRVPSALECSFCDITKVNCPDRVDEEEYTGTSTDF